MNYDLKDMAKHYLNVILSNADFLSPNPVRDIDLLYEPFAELIAKLNEKALSEMGYGFKLTETYRSNTLQHYYFSQGLSKIPANGMHHYGIAADTMFMRDGEATYKGDYAKLHTLFESLDGPDLGSLESWDAGHFQFIPILKQNALRDCVKTGIMNFQRDGNLTVDGIAGPKTHARAVEFLNSGTPIEP